jgi:hypothetical protein
MKPNQSVNRTFRMLFSIVNSYYFHLHIYKALIMHNGSRLITVGEKGNQEVWAIAVRDSISVGGGSEILASS